MREILGMSTMDEFAHALFEVYSASARGKTFDGRTIPQWKDVGDNVQKHWTEVARWAVMALSPELEPQREVPTVTAAIEYAKAPYGDVAHNLKMILAKYANSVSVEDDLSKDFHGQSDSRTS